MNFAEPRVTLVAHTKVVEEEISHIMPRQDGQKDADYLIEFAGRGCYHSYHRPNPKTEQHENYLNRTIFEQEHGSIAEHATATLHFKGVSRAFLAEITRHRTLSFSVRSQRFVNEGNSKIVRPPAIVEGSDEAQLLNDFNNIAIEFYDTLVANLTEGAYLTRKQVREAARAVLPNGTETHIVATGNLRAWIQVLQRRLDPGADEEMRQVMQLALKELQKVSPTLFNPKNLE